MAGYVISLISLWIIAAHVCNPSKPHTNLKKENETKTNAHKNTL